MTPSRINDCRGIVTWAIRAVSLILLATGAYLVLKRFMLAVVARDPQTAFLAWDEIGEGQSFFRGLAMLAVGASLGAAARPLARWVLPVPSGGCPRCGYEKVDQSRCPECGLTGFGGP